MNSKDDKFLRTSEVREILGGISRATLWRWIKDKKIPEPIKIGRVVLFRKSDIDQILQSA